MLLEQETRAENVMKSHKTRAENVMKSHKSRAENVGNYTKSRAENVIFLLSDGLNVIPLECKAGYTIITVR